MQVRSVDISTGGETLRDYTPDELNAIAAQPTPDIKDAIRVQIKALESEQLLPRATREFMLMYMEANAPVEVLAANPGYQAVKAFDEQIKALRAQL